MKHRTIAITTLITIFLSGCSQAYWERVEAQDRAQRAENQARYQNNLQSKCDGYGFQRGTTAYAQCLQTADAAAQRWAMEQNREADRQQQERSKAAWDRVCAQDLACRATMK